MLLFLCTHLSLLLSTHASLHTRSRVDHAEGKKAAIWLAMGLTSFRGLLAAVSALMMTLGAEESFLDCRDAQQQSYGYTGWNHTSISLPANLLGYFTT